jgi:hypothetical protein
MKEEITAETQRAQRNAEMFKSALHSSARSASLRLLLQLLGS